MQTPIRADNCLPDDAAERRQEATVKRTAPVLCVRQRRPAERVDLSIPRANTHLNLPSEAQSEHVGGRGFISSFEALNHRLNCRQHLADRRDQIAGFPSLFAHHYQLLRTPPQPVELDNESGAGVGRHFCHFNPQKHSGE